MINSVITYFKTFSISNFFLYVLRLESPSDKVQRKIGRNLLAIQELENLLKSLNTLMNLSIDSQKGDIESQIMEQRQSHSNKTMGILVNEHLDQNVDLWMTKRDPTDGVVTSFKLQFLPEYYSSKEATLKTLLQQRNELVHHFSAMYKLKNIKDCKNADQSLDKQYKSILEEIEEMTVQINEVRDKLRDDMEYLKSYPFSDKRFFHELIWDLIEISKTIAQEDGWASLSQAGKLIRENFLFDSIMLKDKFGSASLKHLLEKSDKFELKLESGGVFFKVKPGVNHIRGLITAEIE